MSEVFMKQKLSSHSKVDLSRKGAVDAPIVEMISFINSSSAYFTTSSCSGRIYVFENGSDEDQKKKGCQWLYTTHDVCEYTDVEVALKKSMGDASIKFEPFVLHVQCCAMEDARVMHEVAVASGFRNSGITVGKRGKIVVAVRSTHTLEAPLTHNGRLLVDSRYIQFITELACTKLKENFRRIELFFDRLKMALHNTELSRTLHVGEDIHDVIVPTKHCRKTKPCTKVINNCSMDVENVNENLQKERQTVNGRSDDDFDCLDNCLLFGVN